MYLPVCKASCAVLAFPYVCPEPVLANNRFPREIGGKTVSHLLPLRLRLRLLVPHGR